MATTTNQPKSRNRTIWWVIVVLVVLGAGWYMWQKQSSAPSSAATRPAMGMRSQKTPVRTTDVVQGVLEERLQAVGTVQAFNTVTVRSRVEGELIRLSFKDGQFVRAGEVLAQVDPRPFEAKLEQAEGQLKQVQAQLSQAQNDLNRYMTLQKQNSISAQQVENQRALVMQLKAAVSSAQAAVEDNKVQLNYTKIVAPIDGRLGLRNLDEGNLISAANTDGLVVITQTQPIAVSFALPEIDLSRLFERLHLEESLPVTVRDRQNKLLSTGVVLAVDNQINIDTGTVRVKAAMPNLDNSLFPNQFVSISVLLGKRQGLVIPNAAIQSGSIGDFVYLMAKDQTVSVRPIKIALSSDEQSLITEGLELGDKVVVEGTDRLREGSEVAPINGTVVSSDERRNGAVKPQR